MKPRESMVSVCVRRVAEAGALKLYEHEVGRLAGELAGSVWDFGKHRACTAAEVEIELRSGWARFYGVPVRCV